MLELIQIVQLGSPPAISFILLVPGSLAFTCKTRRMGNIQALCFWGKSLCFPLSVWGKVKVQGLSAWGKVKNQGQDLVWVLFFEILKSVVLMVALRARSCCHWEASTALCSLLPHMPFSTHSRNVTSFDWQKEESSYQVVFETIWNPNIWIPKETVPWLFLHLASGPTHFAEIFLEGGALCGFWIWSSPGWETKRSERQVFIRSWDTASARLFTCRWQWWHRNAEGRGSAGRTPFRAVVIIKVTVMTMDWGGMLLCVRGYIKCII